MSYMKRLEAAEKYRAQLAARDAPPAPGGASSSRAPPPLPPPASPPDDVPAMPVTRGVAPEHRPILPDHEMHFNACVARPVSKKEVASNPKALEAVLKEWTKLREAGVWDETRVTEWSEVAAKARTAGVKAHVGRIFEICVEKGAELPAGDPGRKFKGRVVFQGNLVKDEAWQTALFQDLSSSPATMCAAKGADAYGLLEGHTIQQADAEQAYIQSKLGGEQTWVRLPRERWHA